MWINITSSISTVARKYTITHQRERGGKENDCCYYGGIMTYGVAGILYVDDDDDDDDDDDLLPRVGY